MHSHSLSPTIELAKQLISLPSVTPEDAGCQTLIAERLRKIGFSTHSIHYNGVQNLFAFTTHQSTTDPSTFHQSSSDKKLPLFAFAGHTDVVPAGNLEHWLTPPFIPTIKNNMLYGRGSADMKGSLAAMVTACERFLKKYPHPKGNIAFLITSDEEGEAKFGTQKIMEHLSENNILLNYCIVGEPSSLSTLGDTLKNGRRGSMSGRLKVIGKQGHVAYPDRADNPIHRIMHPLHKLATIAWDKGNNHFPPTSFQISNIQAGTGAGNVIPGALDCLFNFRFSPELSAEMIQEQVHRLLSEHGLEHNLHYELEWQLFGKPFFTKPGILTAACIQAIKDIVGTSPRLSTDGGTSDARFITGPQTEVIELGPCNATIHAVNECVSVEELENLSKVYENILEKLLGLNE